MGPVVERGFLRVVMPKGVSSVGKIPNGASGRLELAEWITSLENPLPSRVYANRIWYHLFGRGIVESTDNFGEIGEPPYPP